MQSLPDPSSISCRNWETHPELHMKSQETPNAKTILRKENRTRILVLPDFKSLKLLQNYSDPNSVVLAHRRTFRPKEQDRRPRNKPSHVGPSGLNETAKTIRRRKGSLVNKRSWESWKSTHRRAKLDPYFTACAKIKMIEDLNVRA